MKTALVVQKRISAPVKLGAIVLIAALLAITGFGLSAGAQNEQCVAGQVDALRAAVSGGATAEIVLAACDYNLGSSPLVMNAAPPGGVTVRGTTSGDNVTRLLGGGSRVLIINSELDDIFPDVTIENLIIANGQAPNNDYGGGGVFADTGNGTLTLRDVAITGNKAGIAGSGAGLYVSGLPAGGLVLERVVVSGNEASQHGGGLFLDGDLELTIVDSTFEGNTAKAGQGGGIAFLPAANAGKVRIDSSSFIGNAATGVNEASQNSMNGIGGGIAAAIRDTLIVNSTFSGNEARDGGGGIAITADTPSVSSKKPQLIHTTITGNSSTVKQGGGLFIAAGKPEIGSSIISGNTGSASYSAQKDIGFGDGVDKLDPATSQYNVTGAQADAFAGSTEEIAASNNLFNVTNAGLANLADNGGLTRTQALTLDSPARSAGGPVRADVQVDQRGFPRLVTAATAAGAFEGLAAVVWHDEDYEETLHLRGASVLEYSRISSNPAGLIEDDSFESTGEAGTFTVKPDGRFLGQAVYEFTASRQVGDQYRELKSTLVLKVDAVPDLSVTVEPVSAMYYQGQQDAQYKVTVENHGIVPTSGQISLELTGHAIAGATGTNWSCDTAASSCTRTTAIAAGGSSEVIVTVNIADLAPSSATFTAKATIAVERYTDNNLHSLAVTVLPVPRVEEVEIPDSGLYKAGDELTFKVQYDRNVTVSGTPALNLTIGTAAKKALYDSGSGSDELIFHYTIENGLEDADGIVAESLLSLNGGAIVSADGAPARLQLTGMGSTADIVVDAVDPSISQANLPTGRWYAAGETLSFSIVFNETVDVSGSIALRLQIGDDTVEAPGASTGADTITFSYTVVQGHYADEGIELLSIALGADAAIRDTAGNDAVLTLPAGLDGSAILIDGIPPSVEAVELVALPGLYSTSDVIGLKMRFTEAVFVTGSPQLQLQAGDDETIAIYSEGSGSDELLFAYTVQAGHNAPQGLAWASSPFDLSAAIIEDAAGQSAALTIGSLPDLSGIVVDTQAPAISSVTMDKEVYIIGDTILVTVGYTESVVVTTSGELPSLPIMIDGTVYTAEYARGTGTASLQFELVLPDDIEDYGGAAFGASVSTGSAVIADLAGNSASAALPAPLGRPNVHVDTKTPTVESVNVASGVYQADATLEFIVKFDEPVTVTEEPRVPFMIGGATFEALYHSGSGSDTIVYRYSIAPNDGDGNSISLASGAEIGLYGGSLADRSGNAADLTLRGIGDLTNIIVDSVNPVLTGVTMDAADLYKEGDTLRFRLLVSEPVDVDTTGGAPSLRLDIGGETRSAAYAPADSSATELVFSYTIGSDDQDLDGIELQPDLLLNGAAIEDLRGNSLSLDFPAFTMLLIRVDGQPPFITDLITPEDGHYRAGQTLVFGLRISEPVSVDLSGGNRPALELTIGSATQFAEYSGSSDMTDTLEFVYEIVDGDTDEDGLSWLGSLQMNGASITDEAGNGLNVALPAAVADIIVDTTAPAAPVFITADGEVFRTNAPLFSGTAEPGAVVTVSAAGGSSIGIVTADPDGNWSVSLSNIARGSVAISATATDAAGNVSQEATISIEVSYTTGGGGIAVIGNSLQLSVDGIDMTLVLSAEDIAAGRAVLDLLKYSDIELKLSKDLLDQLLKLNNSLVLEIRTMRGSIEIPLADLLSQTQEQGINRLAVLQVGFGRSADQAAASIADALSKLRAEGLTEVLAITVGYEAEDGAQGEIAAYRHRSPLVIALGAEKPPAGTIVARWDEASGKLQFVPARFRESNGQWIADLEERRMGTYIVLHRSATFEDVAAHWSKGEVEMLASMLIIEGRGDSIFDPNGSITRAEFTVLLTRLLGLERTDGQQAVFSDINGKWYEEAVAAAAAAGLVSGYGDGSFQPGATISRQEMAVMLLRSLQWLEEAPAGDQTGASPEFGDRGDVAGWAAEAVRVVAQLGIVQGDDTNRFRPSAEATRAEAAAMLLRLMRLTGLTQW